jgi:predicted nucleic acid-binding Zn ribbon protein
VRRTAPRRLGLALAEVSERLAPATTLAQVQARWPDTVDAAIAAEAEPVSERDGLVTVACRSAVWAQELDLLGPELVIRLNEALAGGETTGGPVRGLRAVVGDPERRPRRRR